MCGRFALTDSEEKIILRFGLNNSKGIINPRYNISPSEKIPVVLRKNGIHYLELMKWGMVPYWSKDKTQLINARVETVTEKPSFREAIKKRRCLIPANGFYEWFQGKSKKYPYFICLKKMNLFAFAGIWESWTSNKGETIKTFAILTTSSNSFVRKIHNRMPIILTQKYFEMWLGYSEISLKDLYTTCSSDMMQAWEINKKVGSHSFDNPNCITKKIKKEEYKEEEKVYLQGSLFD